MRSPFLDRIQGISLKWKIIIPFLFFAFTGTTTLTYVGLTSQQALIRAEEEREVFQHYNLFLQDLEDKKSLVLSLATLLAEDQEIQRLLAERKRARLYRHMINIFVRLRKDFHIAQIHFHIPPAVSFLRVDRPQLYGDDLSGYRTTILDAMREKEPKAGIEMGRSGYGIRGVVPVSSNGEVTGTVEVSYSLGTQLLLQLQKRWGMDLVLYAVDGEGEWRPFAEASVAKVNVPIEPGLAKKAMNMPVFDLEPGKYGRAFLLGPVRDYSGRLIALLQLSLERTQTRGRLAHTRNIMILVGLAGIILSFLLTYLVAVLLIRPIEAIVREAQEIAEEKRDVHIESRPGDEIGTLTKALNLMLDSLNNKRAELERYARTLEKQVEDRTADLVASEEKYRTLVEHVPLIVYRILPDGTTEFVNSSLTKILGYAIEEAVGDRFFWFEKIWRCGKTECDQMWKESFENGDGYRMERIVKDRDGRLMTFIDHAIPARDTLGQIRWVDGIMMDISELKLFQEMALRTEEIRLVEEISAHMAHAIRNPLSSAGGFARRLQNALPGNDPNRRLAEIIVKEVVRIEDFLKVLFSSVRPFDLSYGEVDINQMLRTLLARLEDPFSTREIRVECSFSPSLPRIQADEERLSEALENVLKHAGVLTPPKETLHIATDRAEDRVAVTLTHRTTSLSQDDLDKFFFPHIEEKALWPIIDLSLSRRIIHRHGGKVDIYRQENDCLLMRIELPCRPGR